MCLKRSREFWYNEVGHMTYLFYFQDIIDRMNTEFKPKLITLRSSGEKIPGQDPSVTSDQVDDIVNSSQKNLEGVQSALQLRKFRYICKLNISEGERRARSSGLHSQKYHRPDASCRFYWLDASLLSSLMKPVVGLFKLHEVCENQF